MQHFILNGKILELEKYKETALMIPVLFNAESAEFTLEIPEEQYKEGTAIELSIYRSGMITDVKKVSVELPAAIRRFRLADILEIDPKDYLLYSCRSNHPVRLSLSISALN